MGNELPKDWVKTELKNLAIIQSGGTPARGNSAYWNGNIPWVKISDLKEFYVSETKEFITEKGLDNSSTRVFPKGTILFTIFATIGKVGVLKIEAATNQAIAGITPSKKINSQYLTFSLIELSNEILSLGKGVAQKNINQTILKNTLIPLPPLAEQERIVAKLDDLFARLDKIKTSLAKIPVLLKNFRQQVLNQSVTGKLTEEWREGNSISEGKEYTLEELGDWKGGGTPSKSKKEYWTNGKVLWITPKDMKSTFIADSINKITHNAVENSSAILLPPNCILFVTRSGILRRIFPISSNTKETTVNQDIKALILKPGFNFNFILFALRGLESDLRQKCMKSGTTVESIDFKKLKNYRLNIPRKLEQQEIVNRIECLFTKADKIQEKYELLKAKIEQLPQAILHKAFNGELVPQLESDGDARDLVREIEVLKSQTNSKNKKTKNKKYTTKNGTLNRAAENSSTYKKQ